jgi:hypothetical protein
LIAEVLTAVATNVTNKVFESERKGKRASSARFRAKLKGSAKKNIFVILVSFNFVVAFVIYELYSSLRVLGIPLRLLWLPFLTTALGITVPKTLQIWYVGQGPGTHKTIKRRPRKIKRAAKSSTRTKKAK